MTIQRKKFLELICQNENFSSFKHFHDTAITRFKFITKLKSKALKSKPIEMNKVNKKVKLYTLLAINQKLYSVSPDVDEYFEIINENRKKKNREKAI